MTRKQAREEAFILIFEKCFNDDSCESILELAEQVREIKRDDYVISVKRMSLIEHSGLVIKHFASGNISSIIRG